MLKGSKSFFVYSTYYYMCQGLNYLKHKSIRSVVAMYNVLSIFHVNMQNSLYLSFLIDIFSVLQQRLREQITKNK